LILLFGCRLAYRGGVTRAITAPQSNGFFAGLSMMLDTGASSSVEKGAIGQAEAALHVSVSLRFSASVSTQVAALRQLLYESSVGAWTRVREVRVLFLLYLLGMFEETNLEILCAGTNPFGCQRR
jgi:hypothetical protein